MVDDAPQHPPSDVGALWSRIQAHKVLQWGLAYLGASLALAHGTELLAHAFLWPEVLSRAIVIALVVGFPVALTLAWYHGHRALRQISAGELAIASSLLFIGAVFFAVSLRPSAERAAEPLDATKHAIPGVPETVAISHPPVQPNSIAVLPLENLSPDPNNAYFAEGIHAEIISQLTKLHSLTVMSRDAVVVYPPTKRPPLRQIAADLGVQSLLTGSLQYAGGRIRVGVQLVDPQSGAALWSETYEEDYAKIFAVEADVSMNVANALQAKFTPEEQARIERPPTKSYEAYSLYLQALALNAGQGLTRDDTRIVSLLERAIQLDDHFAAAYAALAFFRATALNNNICATAVDAAHRPELEATVRRLAERAIELDDQLGLAYMPLGVIAFYNWRWSEAEKYYARAIELSPTNSTVATWYGYLLSYTGRHDESLALSRKVRRLEPGNLDAGSLYFKLTMAAKYDEAVASWHRAVNRSPTAPIFRLWLGFTEIARGNDAEALNQLDICDRLLRDSPPIPVIFLPELAYAYARAGRSADARRLVDEIKATENEGIPIGAGGWAAAYLAIGDQPRALEQLQLVAEKAKRHEPDPGFTVAANLTTNMTNDPLLRQPEFAQVLSRIRGD
jgi:TolB-like protein